MIPGSINKFKSPIRQISGRVELLGGSIPTGFRSDGDLISFEIERTSEGKFFGFGVSQKMTVKIRDKNRIYHPTVGEYLVPYLDDILIGPKFYIKEIKRDENNNNLTVTGYDIIERAKHLTWNDMTINGYSLGQIASSVAGAIDASNVHTDYPEFSVSFEDGVNVEGTETLREVLDDIAEATQTYYFINRNNELEFLRLGDDNNNYTIDRSQYFTLKSEEPKTIGTVFHTTVLGDNLYSTADVNGVTQYVRDNMFWTSLDDLEIVVDDAIDTIAGLTITPFDCSWRGCYLLQPGDRLAIEDKDGESIATYLLNDKLTYNGGLKQHTQWAFAAEEATSGNPTSLGEALKQTYAKVDKANKRIDLVVSETNTNKSEIAQLKIDTSGINATVSGLQKTTDDITGDINTLTKQVEASMTESQVEFKIKSQLAEGVDKVKTTEKNYTFDDMGLSISSSESNISTTITEDGMTVKVAGTNTLTANNEGVEAIDLKATTYLIIGKNSRFEDFGSRTACFWIGG